jgi:hypothetical protein
MLRRFWTALPLRVKILMAVLALALLSGIGAWLNSRDSSRTSTGAALSDDDVAAAAWRKELTDGAKAFYGENWEPSKSGPRAIDAMAAESAKTYATTCGR